MCLRLELLELLLNFYSVVVIFFFQIFYPNVFTSILLFAFFLEFALFFLFFSQQKLPKVKNI